MQNDETIYKIIRKSESGNIQLAKDGGDESNAKWFKVSDKVKSFVKNIQIGQTVKIGYFEKGADTVLTYINPINGFIKKTPAPSTTTIKHPTPSNNSDVQTSIIKQVALKTTATVVASLGFTKSDNPEDIINFSSKIFNGFYKKLVEGEISAEAIDGVETITDAKKEIKETISAIEEPEEGQVVIID